MAYEYREETERQFENRIQEQLSNAPEYVKAFSEYIRGKSREARTRHAYIIDVMAFLRYERDVLPEYDKSDVKDIPLEVLDGIRIEDIEEYRTHLHTVQLLKTSSLKRNFSSLSLFFKFLSAKGCIDENPMDSFEAPVTNRHRIITLDASECTELLQGILRNDRFKSEFVNCGGIHYKDVVTAGSANKTAYSEILQYAEENNCSNVAALEKLLKKDVSEDYEIVDIPDDVRQNRERYVLRNYAIVRLFLGAGLRVSELVGLDLDDIDWKNGSLRLIAKGGDEHDVYFGEAVAEALLSYLETPAAEERSGRNGLHPKKNCTAVFLSNRGTRMSVRLVETMIKEMVQTYLPDYQDKDVFTPHKLRATCATRILNQTGDIALAAEQLNHKSVTTTAAFYAQLQKKKQREVVQRLDVDKW